MLFENRCFFLKEKWKEHSGKSNNMYHDQEIWNGTPGLGTMGSSACSVENQSIIFGLH